MNLPMKHIHTIRSAFLLLAAVFSTFWLLEPMHTLAAEFTGGNVESGLAAAEGIRVGGNSDLRATVVTVMQAVLSLMGIIAVLVIVIAGIMLVVGGGSDESRQKTLKIIIYTLVGLIVILLASAFVAFVIDVGTGN